MSESTQPMAKSLNILLANYKVYLHKLLHFSWHLNDSNVYSVQQHIGKFINRAEQRIDDITDKIMNLNHIPLPGMSSYLRNADMDMYVGSATTINALKELVNDNYTLLDQIRKVKAEAILCNDYNLFYFGERMENEIAQRIDDLGVVLINKNTVKKAPAAG